MTEIVHDKNTRFTAAILKGVVEHGDANRHFATKLTSHFHLADARELGIVVYLNPKFAVTELGKKYYKDKKLNELEDAYAYTWDRPMEFWR